MLQPRLREELRAARSLLGVLSVPGYSSHLQDTRTLSTETLPSTLWPDTMCVSNNTEVETARFPLKGPCAHSCEHFCLGFQWETKEHDEKPLYLLKPTPRHWERSSMFGPAHLTAWFGDQYHHLGTRPKCKFSEPPPRPPASGILGEGPRNLCFNRPSRWLTLAGIWELLL